MGFSIGKREREEKKIKTMGSWVGGCFFLLLLCTRYFALLLCCSTYCAVLLFVVQGCAWVDRFAGVSTRTRVRAFFVFFCPPATPAPRWHSSAYHYSKYSIRAGRSNLEPSQATASKHRSPHSVWVRVRVRVRVHRIGWSALGTTARTP